MKFIERDEYLKKIDEWFPEANDESLEKIEFFSRVYDEADKEISAANNTDKVKEVEEAWRKKYRDRFFSGGEKTDEFEEKKKDFNDIFESEE